MRTLDQNAAWSWIVSAYPLFEIFGLTVFLVLVKHVKSIDRTHRLFKGL